MLQAVTADIARLTDWSVVTTLEAGLSFPLNGDIVPVDRPTDEAAVFDRLLHEVDAVLVIAPETDGVLAERCRRVRAAGVASWNCSPASIELCGDKLRLADHLRAYNLQTIPTKLVDLRQRLDETPWPVVLKPRDGAGSCLTFLVENQLDWEYAAQSFREAGASDKCLAQPFVAGRALSVGVNISLDGQRIECLPVGEQRLSDDRRFHYLGGIIPAAIPAAACTAIHELVLAACGTITGLAGYIGFDFLLTREGRPLIVEINPRLTTSYVGYRQLFTGTLPERWLPSTGSVPLATWKPDPIEFLC